MNWLKVLGILMVVLLVLNVIPFFSPFVSDVSRPPSDEIIIPKPTAKSAIPTVKKKTSTTIKNPTPTSKPAKTNQPVVSPTPRPTSRPTVQPRTLDYAPVPESVKNLTVDCQNKDFIPSIVRNNNYVCENIYRVDLNSLKSQIQSTHASRLLLYGQYVYFDCPTDPALGNDVVNRCFQSAKFLDNWQIPKTLSLLSFPKPAQKAYLYFSQTAAQTTDLCNRLGTPGASACLISGYQIYRSSLLYGKYLFHNSGTTTETGIGVGSAGEIQYAYSESTPAGCYSPDVHETTHYLNYQYLGAMTTWVNEGVTRLLESRILNKICPPGITYSRVVKKENGVVSKVDNFNFFALDLQEPLTQDLEYYSSGRRCMKGVFIQTARLLNSQGFGFIRAFYNEIDKLRTQHDWEFAAALWTASGQNPEVKSFLQGYGCNF